MPIKYDILVKMKLILAVGSGVVTGDDVIKHLDDLADDERVATAVRQFPLHERRPCLR